MAGEIDDHDGLEAAAVAMSGTPEGEQSPSGESLHNDTPRCPECGQPVDDIQRMDEQTVLLYLRLEMLRDYARMQRDGTITHQQQNIAKTFIMANLPRIPDSPVEPTRDPNMPAPTKTQLPEREFDTDGAYDETAGG